VFDEHALADAARADDEKTLAVAHLDVDATKHVFFAESLLQVLKLNGHGEVTPAERRGGRTR
jgi:hypothetical protein